MFDVNHSKRLVATQFDAMKGSNIHAIMTARRVWLTPKASPLTRANRPRTTIATAKQKIETAVKWLNQNCTNFYFIADKAGDTELRVYFLSKHDMEHFIVWAKLMLS